MRTYWIAGHTAPKRFAIKDKTHTAVNLTGATVDLILTKLNDPATIITTTGDVAIESPATAGIISFTPDAGDLVAANSPLHARWKITGSDGIAFAPEEDEDREEWIVRSVSP